MRNFNDNDVVYIELFQKVGLAKAGIGTFSLDNLTVQELGFVTHFNQEYIKLENHRNQKKK